MTDLSAFLSTLSDDELVDWDQLIDTGHSEPMAQGIIRSRQAFYQGGSFPTRLVPFRALIESTSQDCVLFRQGAESTEPTQSKIGGRPYFPEDYPAELPQGPYEQTFRWTPWPKRKTGGELQLLLQLNFAQMPTLENFPREGLLQIFVDDHNWLDLGEEMQARYHADTSQVSYDFSQVATDAFRVSEATLHFEKDRDYMTRDDFRFSELFEAQTFEGRSFHELNKATGWQLERDYLSITHHRYNGNEDLARGRNKLGGYHYTQNTKDPRSGREQWRDSVLLVQFQDHNGLEWGDGGSAQIFIQREALLALDFSDLLFHWDST